MAGNTIGTVFKLTTFGESHGNSIGGILDGCPAGMLLDIHAISADLNRRLPKNSFTTNRRETEEIEFLSGIFEGKTLGTPIAFRILNQGTRSEDYEKIKDYFRPSHADRVCLEKYGIRDHRGGGRASGRETAARVVAGAIAKQYLKEKGINIQAYVSAVGTIQLLKHYTELIPAMALQNQAACPDLEVATRMIEYMEQISIEKDSIGGTIDCVIEGCPVGLGEPVFDRLSADLAKAMLSIPSSKGFAFGDGFESVSKQGSEYIDTYKENFQTYTNHSGGIQGGISNAEVIYFTVPFRPVSSIQKPLPVISDTGTQATITLGGRHDACHVPRIVPVVECMAALVLADHWIRYYGYK